MKQVDAVKSLADKLAEKLVQMGFIVHRYDAYSTESIYLKLDCGVCNSIRISGHRGKGHLKYRYNIGPSIQARNSKIDRFKRYYYPSKDYKSLLDQIAFDRNRKLEKYGKQGYKELMIEYRHKGMTQSGFWQKAHLVNTQESAGRKEKLACVQ